MNLKLDAIGGREGALVTEKGSILVMGEFLMPQKVLLAASPVLARTPITGPRLSLRRSPMLIVNNFLSRVGRNNLPVALAARNRVLLPVVSKQEASIDEILGALPTTEVEGLDFFSGCRHPGFDLLEWH